VLGVLIAAQITATFVLAVSATHNGWVYFQGGDQIVNTTTGWLLGQLQIPPTEVGYIWPVAQVPITWVTGPTFVQALPALVFLDVLILGPIALLCVYEIAAHIGGRLIGYWAALLWVVAPFVAIPLFDQRYHEKWIDQFLPQALGLTAMPDYPSMVIALAAAVFVVHSLSPGRILDAVLAGLLAGAAGGLKPPNYLFAIGAVLAYLLARRWREGTVFVIVILPSLLVLAFWKDRGLGYVPALTLDHIQLATGRGAVVGTELNLDRYINLDFQHWRDQMDQLREFFWSARLAQWAPFAGLIAVVRVRRGAIAALLGGWLAAYVVVKGFSPRASIESNTFWRLLMPAWPAYLLLFACIPLLVPTFARRLGDRMRGPHRTQVRARWIVLAIVLTIAVPAAATAASTQLGPPDPDALVQTTSTAATILTPVDDSIDIRIEPTAAGQRVTWTGGPWRADVFYRLYRFDGGESDVDCRTRAEAAWDCYMRGTEIGVTREHALVDPKAPPGAVYRVGVGTNWVDDPEQGDIFAFSPSARAAR